MKSFLKVVVPFSFEKKLWQRITFSWYRLHLVSFCLVTFKANCHCLFCLSLIHISLPSQRVCFKRCFFQKKFVLQDVCFYRRLFQNMVASGNCCTLTFVIFFLVNTFLCINEAMTRTFFILFCNFTNCIKIMNNILIMKEMYNAKSQVFLFIATKRQFAN